MSDPSSLASALKAIGWRQRKLAEAAGVTQSAISQAIKAGRVSGELALKIERGTEGRITVEALRPDLSPSSTGAVA